MKEKVLIKWMFILLGFFWTIPEVWAIQITVTGEWTLVIDESDLVAGPGSDLTARYLSATDQVVVDITQTNTTWRVYIQGSFTNWHSDLTLDVRRTSNGTGPANGSISGGTSWRQVTASSQEFFNGRRRRTGVNIRYRLNGMSVQVPPDTYSATITYTVVEY